MSYIYVITNDINNKQYVGKTNRTIKERFKEHIKNKSRLTFEKRPLYDAMNKYGIEHFSIEQLEECLPEEAATRERYWIDKLNTYYNGYNATCGGDGKTLYDYEEIAKKYLELKNQQETAKFFHCDTHTVRTACRSAGIKILSPQKVVTQKCGKKIYCVELNKTFDSQGAAARFLQQNGYTSTKYDTSIIKNISRSCKDKKGIKTAYKMHWKYL